MQYILDKAVKYGRNFISYGKTATYIPELSKVNPNRLGAVVVTLDGDIYCSGDYSTSFSMQSVSKPVALMLAIQDRGEEFVFDRVGMEPTGDAFNSIIKLETIKPSKPLNPMINAGAIAIDSYIIGNNGHEKFKRLIEFFRIITANQSLWYNHNIYKSENDTGFRNRALANFMKDNGTLIGDVDEALELYFKQCSIEVVCQDIATIGSVLAADGISPITGDRIVNRHIANLVKTFMVTCGMYDASGEFAVKVGIPAKSGVGGGIMAAVPGKMGIGVFSPALDGKGNSTAGVKVLEYLSQELDLSIF